VCASLIAACWIALRERSVEPTTAALVVVWLVLLALAAMTISDRIIIQHASSQMWRMTESGFRLVVGPLVGNAMTGETYRSSPSCLMCRRGAGDLGRLVAPEGSGFGACEACLVHRRRDPLQHSAV
jgi:hypothetical protein